MADLESLPCGDHLCAAPLADRRLKPHLADDVEYQAIDELVVQEVRPEERGVDNMQEIRREHLSEQCSVRVGFGVYYAADRLHGSDLVHGSCRLLVGSDAGMTSVGQRSAKRDLMYSTNVPSD